MNYVSDERTVLYDIDRERLVARVREGKDIPAFEMAGPRHNIFFDPARVKAAIVTCGGLCPGINNVIRTLVFELYYRYGVRSVLGHPLRLPRLHPQVRLRACRPQPG